MRYIVKTIPNHTTEIFPVNSVIHVQFSMDVDAATVDNKRFVLLDLEDQVVVLCDHAYKNKTVFIKPQEPLASDRKYQVTVLGKKEGIQFVNGVRLEDSYFFEFKTSRNVFVGKPELTAPLNDSVVQEEPVQIFWKRIEDCLHYEVQISKSNTFNIIEWPEMTDKIAQPETGNRVSVVPDMIFLDKQRYYVRVRAFSKDNEPGDFSEPIQFVFRKQESGPGILPVFPAPETKETLHTVSSSPKDGEIHVFVGSLNKISVSSSMPIHPDDVSKIYVIEERN